MRCSLFLLQVIVRIKQEAEQLNEKYNEDLGKHESTSQEVTALRAQISELKQVLRVVFKLN